MTLLPVKVAPEAIRAPSARYSRTTKAPSDDNAVESIGTAVKRSEVALILHNYDINISHPQKRCHILHPTPQLGQFSSRLLDISFVHFA